MSTSDSCKDTASKSNNDEVCDKVNDMLQNMSTADVSLCANCGKEGDDVNNICNKCKKATYCNAACKKKHRHKHKKDCEEYQRLATEKHNKELRLANELHDKKLFKQPPPTTTEEDCPICFLRMPILNPTGSTYKTCCGKTVCSGCIHAPVYDDQGNLVDINKQNECPFCRVVAPKSDEEGIKRFRKRVEANDPMAMNNLGCYYRDGLHGLPKDYTKALELWHRAADLGHAGAYCCIGYAYKHGEGVEMDEKKASHYYELAAMRGCVQARHNVGVNECHLGNFDRALKHYMIAVRTGYAESLEVIKQLYSSGYATKDDYTHALQFYQEYLSEIKSVQRDEAAVFDSERYRYY